MAPFAALLLFAFMIQMSCGTEVTITKDDQLCLYADLRIKFSVLYEVAEQKTQVAVFELPEKVTTDRSMCGKEFSVLELNFGDGHSLSVMFSVRENVYQANLITFNYNLRDKTIFKDSVLDETRKVKVIPHIPDVELGTCYSCKSKDTILSSPTVNMTLWNVLIQAFVSDGTKSQKTTLCPADVPFIPTTTTTTAASTTTTTTAASTTTTAASTTTTAASTTTTTTAASTTTTAASTTTTAASTTTTAASTTTTAASTTTTAASTTAASTTAASTTPASATTSNATTPNATTPTTPTTPTPTPTLPTPTTGNFSVTPVNSTDACLLFNVGLRIGYKQENKYVEKNFDSNKANFSGSCDTNGSYISLVSESMTFRFTFTNDTKKFHLSALNVTVNTIEKFSEYNTSLSLWEASMGSSYMCNKEQNFTISDTLTLFTFNLHVQPFGVRKGIFSTAHECSLDDTSILIPIIVGAALAGLILIVVIAYVIGRRKTYVGYQTL